MAWEKENDREFIEDYYLYRKSKLKSYKNLQPSELKSILFAGSISRIITNFRTGHFAILSEEKNKSLKKNLESQYKLGEKIRSLGYCFIPVLHYYDYIGYRGLFIFRVGRRAARLLAQGLRYYIYGNNGHWRCYRASTGLIVASGIDFKVISLDEQQIFFTKIARRKQQLMEQLENTQRKHKILDGNLEKAIIGLRREIQNTERIEEEILYEPY